MQFRGAVLKSNPRPAFGVGSAAWRLLSDDTGQDLIEYALLSSAIGLAGYLALNYLTGAMNTTYGSWDTAVQSDALVEVPDPVSAP